MVARNRRYVAVYINAKAVINSEILADLARFIHEKCGGLTRAVYVSGCGHPHHPTAKITLGRFLDGYNKILLEGGETDFEMLISAETGLIIVSGGNGDPQADYIARARNKPETTWWLNRKSKVVGLTNNNPHEPRDCPPIARVPAIASAVTSRALAEFPRG